MAKKRTTRRAAGGNKNVLRYRKDFLDQVIARVDFAGPLGIAPKGPPQALVGVIKRRFPVADHKKLVTKTVHVSQQETQVRQEEAHQWLYFSKDRGKVIKVEESALILQYKKGKYESFTKLQRDFLPVAENLCDALPDVQVKRLGLRYVDKIELSEGQPTEWGRYLDADLLAIFTLADDRATICRVLQWLELNYGDMSLRFQCGMPNPDYPAPIKQKVFMLDYDAFCTLLLTKSEIGPCLTQLHDKTRRAFEDVIKDALRKKMKVVYAR